MTLLKPSLFLQQLIVTRDSEVAYRERFHTGVNIIRGTNSSGKSTVADLIFFALGGEGLRWKPETLLCNSVFAEVLVNGTEVTLRRDISDKPSCPMHIFWGSLEEANANSIGWERYAFARSASKESFSQVLFRALGLPEVHPDGASMLTMHQILRMIYVDQASGSQIFRYERFDKALTREAIGDVLTGIYSDRLYRAQLELEAADREFDATSRQLREMVSLLGKAGQFATVSDIRGAIDQQRQERESLYEKLQAIRSRAVDKAMKVRSDEQRARSQDKLNQFREAKSAVDEAESAIGTLRLEVSDSGLFIKAIENRLASLDDASAVREELDGVLFSFCPMCFAPVSERSDATGSCQLCGSPTNVDAAGGSIHRMRNQLAVQLVESRRLNEEREKVLATRIAKMPELFLQLEAAAQRYNDELNSSNTATGSEIEEVARAIGSTDAQIDNLVEKERLFGLIEDGVRKRDELNAQIATLRDSVILEKEQRDRRKQQAYLSVATKTVELLRRDLYREEDFKEAAVVEFDFGADRVSVDGKSNFSASSMVYLRNVFHLALLWTSTDDPSFRLPRVTLFDGLEEGGMEAERSQNLQRLIVDVSNAIEVEHQIIFTTSEIANELEDSEMTVGAHYNPHHKSLAIGRRPSDPGGMRSSEGA